MSYANEYTVNYTKCHKISEITRNCFWCLLLISHESGPCLTLTLFLIRQSPLFGGGFFPFAERRINSIIKPRQSTNLYNGCRCTKCQLGIPVPIPLSH